ncbi:hypothetical protein BDZ94DRAFT_1238983 [Collybia nuda]|uniref:Uncharacterized protein n=1 Tax=Collybia nuda TaxID=64659 RepID=A0A9P5XZ43_9AGAR|nr:hypothetical protein BDZ94DRAFT_1238983 [Collybia nuda]
MPNSIAKLWGRNARVIAVRSRPSQTPSSTVPTMTPETDWIARAIDIMKLVGGAGEMVAFPYIKGAANVIIALLEPIQELKRNQDDFKDLVEGLVEIVVLMRDETLEDVGAPPSHFLTLCKEFNEFVNLYVLLMLVELNKAMSSMRGNWVKQYWKSNSFAEMILRHERRLQTLRQNLTLVTVVGNRRHLEARASSMVSSKNGDSDIEDVIRPGDIRILHETGYVYVPQPGSEHDATITEHSAKVAGDVKTLWKAHLQYHSQIRHHPGVLQLFGVTKSPEHLALIFHGDMKSLKAHVATLDPCERVIFIYRMTQDNRILQPTYIITATRTNEETTTKSTVSWRSLTFPNFITPIPPDQMGWIANNPKGLKSSPHNSQLKSYLMLFCDMVASIMSQQRIFSAVSFEHISLFGVYVGPIDKKYIGQIAFKGIPARPPSTRIPWFIEDNTASKVPYSSFGDWTCFTIKRSDQTQHLLDNIITARTSMLDAGSAHLSKACAAQANILFPQIENACEDKSDARERLLVLNDAFGRMKFKATFPDSSVAPHVKKLYLFVQNVEVRGDGSVAFPETFWAINQNGKPENRLPEAVLEALRVDTSIISLQLITSLQRWAPYHIDALHDIQQTSGFEAGSDEAVRFLGFPLAAFERSVPDWSRLGSVGRRRTSSLDIDRGGSVENTVLGSKGTRSESARGRSVDGKQRRPKNL